MDGGPSVDLAYESSSDRIANAANTLEIRAPLRLVARRPPRLDLSRSRRRSAPHSVSVNKPYGYNNLGEGFYYNPPRRFQMSLTVDI